jgi:flagellar hook-basal body complex protein FliE
MITPLAAAKAYQFAQKGAGATTDALGLGSGGGGGVGGIGGTLPSLSGGPARSGGFGDILKSAMTDAMSATKHAERQMAAQVAGKTELVDVVTAISAAESSLETVIAVRDQVISAYQEIMRMPI